MGGVAHPSVLGSRRLKPPWVPSLRFLRGWVGMLPTPLILPDNVYAVPWDSRPFSSAFFRFLPPTQH